MQGSVTEFLKPRVVKVQPVAPRQARVVIEPFERGFGHTLERLDHHARLARGHRLHLHHPGSQELAYGTLHCSLTLPARWDRRKRTVGPSYMGAAGTRCKWARLLRIQLDDQVLIDVGQDIVPARRRLEQATELLVVHLDPFGQADLLRDVQRALDTQLLARSLAHLDDVPGLHLE